MPRNYNRKSEGRIVGKSNVREYKSLTERQKLWLGALIVFCQTKECAVFVGTMTTTGSVGLNFYWNEDKCKGSLHFMDNWAEEVPIMLSDVFDEEITIQTVERAVPWLAVAAAEVAQDKKPMTRTREAVEVPQRPS